jgi:hypothetical protein
VRGGIAALGLFLAAAGVGVAQDEDPGHFEVRAGSTDLVEGTYFVDAQIYLRLPSEATNALHSRLPLTIRVEVEFLNRLRLWWDPVEFEASRRSQLMYYPVTDRYVVTHIDSGDREDFVTLAGALEFIGRVDQLEIVDAALLDRDRRYEVRVRAVLDKDELPGPLRLLAFWRRDWSIASDWLLWRLDED